MAEEALENARIDQLPPSAGVTSGSWLAMWNGALSRTERIAPDQVGGGSTDTQNFEWVSDTAYLEDDVVTFGGLWYQALVDNTGVTPGTDPATWLAIPKSPTGLVPWEAGVFVEEESLVFRELDNFLQLFRLANVMRPFISSDFDDEFAAGDWQLMSERGYMAYQKTAHGFSVNTVLTHKSGNWNVCDGDDTPVGLCRQVIDANAFVVVFFGSLVRGMSGLTGGQMYYAQPDGTIGTTDTGKPVLFGLTSTTGILLASGSGGGGAVPDADETTKGIAKLYPSTSLGTNVDGAPTQNAVKTYTDAAIAAAVAGLLDLRGDYDASVNAYPTTGGSGTAGAILKADAWVISVAGTLPTGRIVSPGDVLFARIDAPGSTSANWAIIENNLTFTPVNKAGDTMTGALDMGANKVTSSGVPSTGNDLVNKTYADGLAGVGITKLDTFETRRTITANHTLDATDLANINAGKQYVIEVNSATGVNVEIPLNATVAFTTGSSFCIEPIGAGQVSITYVVGVTYRARNNANKSYAQYSRIYLNKAATNTWDGSGDLTV